MSTPKSDLFVITSAKNLVDYVYKLNDNAPKKFRFSIIDKIDNKCLELIESLYFANAYKLNDPRRKDNQTKAKTIISLIDYIFYMGVKRQCYTSHQYEVVSKLLNDCSTYLTKWIMSDGVRLNK